ncbi:MAG: hypothetical protein L0H29_00960 [Sinobacteraceae bacterium]|nr:hypothetical protein [Nevskiaceae bacterium]
MEKVSTNSSCKAFVIQEDEYTRSMSFQYVYDQLVALSERLHAGVEVWPSEIGTMHQYYQYQELLRQAAEQPEKLGTWYSPHTPKKVCKILEKYRRSGRPLRIFYGDRDTGRDWLEESDVLGTVGRSTGTLKIPLLMPVDEDYAPGMLDDCIVRIVDASTCRELWRHPKYASPELRIVDEDEPSCPDLPYEVWADKQVHARFAAYATAALWVAYMHGQCMRSPH